MTYRSLYLNAIAGFIIAAIALLILVFIYSLQVQTDQMLKAAIILNAGGLCYLFLKVLKCRGQWISYKKNIERRRRQNNTPSILTRTDAISASAN